MIKSKITVNCDFNPFYIKRFSLKQNNVTQALYIYRCSTAKYEMSLPWKILSPKNTFAVLDSPSELLCAGLRASISLSIADQSRLSSNDGLLIVFDNQKHPSFIVSILDS